MKKIIASIVFLFSITFGVFSLENTFTFDYGMPMLFWNSSDYDYFQHGYEFMMDYRGMNNDFGFQFTFGIGEPISITRTSTVSDYSSTIKAQTSSQDWITMDVFAGLSFRTMATDLVELYITPGVGFTYDIVTKSSGDKTNFTVGAGVDIASYVILGDSLGFTAGILTQYQMYQIEKDYGSSTEYRNKVSNLSFIPRAGMYITF